MSTEVAEVVEKKAAQELSRGDIADICANYLMPCEQQKTTGFP